MPSRADLQIEMFIRPKVLSLITTHQCTASCDHCCFSCTPKVTKAIPYERLIGLVEEAKGVPSIELVAFTGGECFLLKQRLDQLISRATKLGLKTRCVTNGYWATSQKVAENRVDNLVSAGLTEINFSTGEFHARDVPPKRIVYGALATAKAGITTLINIEIFSESQFDPAIITENPELKAFTLIGLIKVQRNVWIANGGAQDLSHATEHSRFSAERISGCSTAMNVVAVTPDMSLVACCGLHMEKIPELHLGSVANDSIAQVLNLAKDDFLKIWINVEGPERILNFVKDKNPTYAVPTHCVHPCETCLHLYSDDVAKQVISDNYMEVEGRVSSLFLANLASTSLRQRVVSALTLGADQ